MSKVIKVDENNRNYVANQLKLNLLHNIFVIYDLFYKFDKITLYVAYHDNYINGLLLIYKNTPLIVRLDGDSNTAQKLLKYLPKENMVLFFPPSLVETVKEIFPEANGCYSEYQMYVERKKEHLVVSDLASKLKPEHALLLAELYSSSPYTFYSKQNEKKCKEILETSNVFGIFYEGKLIAAATSMRRLLEVGEVTNVLTHPEFRRMGYGTIVASAATKDVLKHAQGSTLYVATNNIQAIRIYEKLGYRKIEKICWVSIRNLDM